MVKEDVAQAVLAALGGRENVQYNTVCMTRLRVTLVDPSIVAYDQLNEISGVLGTATRGENGIEVVFGPRTIDGVYHAFVKLTGVAPGTDALFPMSRQESNMRIQINPPSRPARDEAVTTHVPFMNDDELSMLDDLFGPDDDDRGLTRLLVVNGPNINMLGLAPCDEVPLADYPSLLELCKSEAEQAGFTRCDCYQSNHEGDLIDHIQDAYGMYEALVVNPGPNTAPSDALCEALRTVDIPTIVVNLFDAHDQDVHIEQVSGRGTDGYRIAIERLARQCVQGA